MNHLNLSFVLVGILFIAVFIFFTVRRNSLTIGGAITAAGMGVWVVIFAGVQWLIPLFFFFISGTLLGKLNSGSEIITDEKHGKGRDAWQVICNGFPYAFLATFTIIDSFSSFAFFLMFVSVSIAVADTWSSEIGMFFQGKTIDILKFEKLPPGVSGGVSFAGTIGGLAGGISAAVICVLLDFQKFESPIIFIGMIGFAGFCGMLLDSVLGSGFQKKYKNIETGEVSDVFTSSNNVQSGLTWMTNDVVNLVSNLIGTAIFGGLFYLFL